MLNKLALPAAIILVLLSAVLAAWGANDGVVLLGKRLMSATIFAFVFCNFFEARAQRSSAIENEKPHAFPAERFLIGSATALAVGAMALTTLSNDWVHGRKCVVIVSAAAIALSTAIDVFLKRARSARPG